MIRNKNFINLTKILRIEIGIGKIKILHIANVVKKINQAILDHIVWMR